MCSHALASYYVMQSRSNKDLPSYVASVNSIEDFVDWAEGNGHELIFIDQLIDALNEYNPLHGTSIDFESVLEWIYEEKDNVASETNSESLSLFSANYERADQFISWLTDRSIIASADDISAFDGPTIRGMVKNFNRQSGIQVTAEEVIQQLKRNHAYAPASVLKGEGGPHENLYIKSSIDNPQPLYVMNAINNGFGRYPGAILGQISLKTAQGTAAAFKLPNGDVFFAVQKTNSNATKQATPEQASTFEEWTEQNLKTLDRIIRGGSVREAAIKQANRNMSAWEQQQLIDEPGEAEEISMLDLRNSFYE
jgi:hypothetical protein